MKNEAIPRLRFEGFNNKWNKKDLGDVGKVQSCRRIFKRETTSTRHSNEVPFYKISTFGGIATSFISDEEYHDYKREYPYPNIGDILLSASGTLGKTVVYTGEKAYYQDSNIIWLDIDKKQILNSFLLQFYQVVHWGGIEGSTIKRLYNRTILHTPIILPSLPEQQLIGKFFAELDKLIQLQQKKVALLKKLKRGYLQKLYPCWRQQLPDLRFDRYNNLYSLKKMGNIVSKMSIKNKSQQITNVESISNVHGFIRQTNQFNNYSVASVNLSNYHIIKPGMFAYNPSRISVGSIAYKEKNKEKNSPISIVSSLYVPFKTNRDVNDLYLWYWFQTDNFEAQRIKYSEGGVRLYLFFNRLSEMSVNLPPLSEQYDVGQFMKNIDTAIKIQSNKLIQLRKLKKAYLQKMFC